MYQGCKLDAYEEDTQRNTLAELIFRYNSTLKSQNLRRLHDCNG